jgi:hypothetical protein
MCAVDRPTVCVNIPKPPFVNLDPRKTLVVVVYKSGSAMYSSASPLTDYAMLQAVVYSSPAWAVVNVTRPGLLYASSQFKVYSFSTKMQVTSASYTVCGQTYANAYWANAGLYNVSSLTPPLYWLDVNTCISYKLVDKTSNVANVTLQWFSLYVATLLPNTTKIFYDFYWRSWNLNGTSHMYRTHFHYFASPIGFGIYIANGTVTNTLVMQDYYGGSGFYAWSGPMGFDVLKNATFTRPIQDTAFFYGIGDTYGDAPIFARFYSRPYVPFNAAYVADGTAGYATVNKSVYIFAAFFKRYAVAEVAVQDVLYTYATRGIACPYVNPAGGVVRFMLNRLDRVQELEVCNNATAPAVVALFGNVPYSYYSEPAYFFADRADVGKCVRLKWDTSILAKPELHVYTSERDLCKMNPAVKTTSYNPGWRHYYFANGTIKAVQPVSPDAMYDAMWQQIMQTMAQMYNNTLNAIKKWLQMQANATQSLQSLATSMPQFFGTIKMESATSTGLRATLNELQKWKVVGSSASFGAVSLPAVPAAVAPAAAAAAAVAWAASRRDDDVATTAAVAGIALALFGILMTLIYGTSSLTLVALGIIVAAAAAAWRRIS